MIRHRFRENKLEENKIASCFENHYRKQYKWVNICVVGADEKYQWGKILPLDCLRGNVIVLWLKIVTDDILNQLKNSKRRP